MRYYKLLSIAVPLMVAFTPALAQEVIERIKITDNNLSCRQIFDESAAMDKTIADARAAQSSAQTTATAGQAAGVAAEVASRTGLFGSLGGLTGHIFGTVASKTAANVAEQTGQQGAAAAAEREKQAVLRKEYLAQLFLTKGCSAADPSAPGATPNAAIAMPTSAVTGLPKVPEQASKDAQGNNRAAMKPFDLNMDRVSIVDPNGLGSQTYFVPGFNLVVTSAGDVWAQSKVWGNAQAHGRFYVQGLDKPFLTDLARKAQDDLVAKLRLTGATVLTYEDLKDHPVVAGQGRRSPDPKWGLPTSSLFSNLTFLTAAPSDRQLYEKGMAASAAFWLNPLAKEKNLVVIFPEVTFTVPQMWGEVDAGYKRDSAGIAVNSVMLLHGAAIHVTNPQNSFTNIAINTHGKRPASEVTGTVKLMSADKTEFSRAWQRSSSDWVMTVDSQAFSDGVLRVSYAINSMVADQVAKARK